MKAKKAGSESSLYRGVPELSGKSMMKQHAMNTAKALNKMNRLR
jgi:hypothetical protein